MIADEDFLSVGQVLEKIKQAAGKNDPFSLVRIGDGENLVLAQEKVLPMKKILAEPWVIQANKGQKGVYLPNLELRDQMVESIKKADVVGIPFSRKDIIIAPERIKRPLTDKIFACYGIEPRYVCHTFVNRVFAQKREFWSFLKGRNILLLSIWAERLKRILRQNPYRLDIALALPFYHYVQLESTLKTIAGVRDYFDIALISCGVNAVVLSQRISELTGKICIDFGKSSMFMIQRKAGLKYSSSQAKINMLP